MEIRTFHFRTPLVLNSAMTFVPGSVRCSSALCLFYFIIEILLYFLIIKSYPKEFVDITL